MNKRIGIICLLTFLYAPFAEAQTASPHSDLATVDWSAKQAQSLNAQPKQAVWKFLNDVWTGNQNYTNEGKLCSFQFADLRHSGELSLAVVYDSGGTADCNDFNIYDKTPTGIELYDFSSDADAVFDGIRDIEGDGNHEVVVDRSFAWAGRDHCSALWSVIYAWNGAGYANVSQDFKGFYRQRLQELTRRLAPSPTPTPVSERVQTFESQPLGGSGPQLRLRMMLPQASPTSESESSEATSDTGDTDCLKAEAAKIERFLGMSSDAGMLEAIKWKNSNNPDDREFAVFVLDDIRTPEAIGDLRTLSRDPDPDVARFAKGALEDVTKPFVFPTIQAELLTKDTGTPSAK